MTPSVEADDATLIDRAKTGDERAFALLYKRHSRPIAALVYRLLGSDHHLEDVVQETFIIGLRQLDALRSADAFGGWLRTIAVRRVKRLLAQRYKTRTLQQELSNAAQLARASESDEQLVALYRALDNLPHTIRLPWMLHHIEGETLPAVATLCGTSLSTVKRQIKKATDRLRRMHHVA